MVHFCILTTYIVKFYKKTNKENILEGTNILKLSIYVAIIEKDYM